jgi:hypothetical protein
MATSTLFLRRFDVDAHLVDDKICGNGTRDFFSVEVTVVTHDLDEQGFVIEVQDLLSEIRDAFANGGDYLKASCEELANGVLHVIYNEIGKKRLLEAKARVFNRTGHLDAVYYKGMSEPAFPADASEDEVSATIAKRNGGGYTAPSC